MPGSSSAHDLRAVIRSHYPLVIIETVEEERVEAMLRAISDQDRIALFDWSVARGLNRADTTPVLNKMTSTAMAVLQHLHGMTASAIFWLKDMAPHLQDAATARQLREVCQQLGKHGATCVITGEPINLP